MVESLFITADEQIPLAEKVFSKFGNINLVDGRYIDRNKIKNTDVLLVRSVTKINKSLLENTKVKFVGSATSGVDHVDVDYLDTSNISFSYAPGSNANSVAEYVLNGLIATISNKGSPFSLSEKKIGIVGCGRIGSRVKYFMDIFDIECVLNDPPLFDQTKNRSFVDLEEVLQCDIITLHVPLTKEGKYPTYNLVNDKFLEKLKSGVILINTSRGDVIDEQALISFKKRNPESKLILDVWRNEPNINIDLLEKVFIGTPHIAGYSLDAKISATKVLFDSLQKFFKTNFNYSNFVNEDNTFFVPNMSSSDYLIDSIISQYWDIMGDNISFSHYSSLEDNERSIFYDSLRKNYPIRHEFGSSIIDMSQCDESFIFDNKDKNDLRKLGFKFKNL
ncbi:MAG: 4-phosphoerythronate dehydrogenase [Pseudomonadota bacterium]|nr:4-phosphoerythronate dehydrogenase [Pseudomonadota bacterium]